MLSTEHMQRNGSVVKCVNHMGGRSIVDSGWVGFCICRMDGGLETCSSQLATGEAEALLFHWPWPSKEEVLYLGPLVPFPGTTGQTLARPSGDLAPPSL